MPDEPNRSIGHRINLCHHCGNLIIEIDSRPWRLIVSASRQVEGSRLNSALSKSADDTIPAPCAVTSAVNEERRFVGHVHSLRVAGLSLATRGTSVGRRAGTVASLPHRDQLLTALRNQTHQQALGRANLNHARIIGEVVLGFDVVHTFQCGGFDDGLDPIVAD